MSRTSAPCTSSLTDLLFEERGAGRCLVAPDGTILRANSEWLRSTRFTLDEVLGADILDLFPETRDLALGAHARARAGHPVAVPRHLRRVQGRETWWDGSIVPVPMEGGTGLLIIEREVDEAIPRDSGAGARTEERLDEVLPIAERLAAIVECSDDAIISKDLNGIILTWNAGAEQLFGYVAGEVIGRPITMLIPPDRQHEELNILRQLRSGKRVDHLETKRLTKGGTVIDVSITSSPIRDATGRIVGASKIARDITDRKRAGEVLRESERQMRTLLENVTVGVALIDESGWFTLNNRRFLELFGLSPSATPANVNAQDWSAWKVVDEERRPLDVDEHPVRKVARTGRPVRSQLVGVLRPGEKDLVWMLVSADTIVIRGQSHIVCTYQDITKQKAAEQAALEADQRKAAFLAVLSHELRNPLAPIRNSVHLLDRAAPGSDVARRARDVLHRQTEHLARLVDDLLDITRITHDKIELQLARIDARDVVRRACDDANSLFEQRGVELHLSQSAEPTWVDADAARLAQMVGNILNNALKFTRPRGQVHVGVRKRGGECEVTVRDTGMGIEAADLERIFDSFVQAERTRARAAGGMGIGLALVRELAQKHGGAVRAMSAGPGKGAEFVLTLPLAVAPADAASPASAKQDVSTLSVLIVEDNEDAGASLADLLALGGHQVKVVTTGREGIAAVSARPPDVLICDVGLPDLNGYDLIRAVRSASSGGRVFAIALTGYTQPQDREQARDAGFDAHLSKPPPLDHLQGLLAEAARRHARDDVRVAEPREEAPSADSGLMV